MTEKIALLVKYFIEQRVANKIILSDGFRKSFQNPTKSHKTIMDIKFYYFLNS